MRRAPTRNAAGRPVNSEPSHRNMMCDLIDAIILGMGGTMGKLAHSEGGQEAPIPLLTPYESELHSSVIFIILS